MERSHHRLGPRRVWRRRGAALLATVLLCSTAATIALVVLRQATATGRFEAYQRSSAAAAAAVHAAAEALEARLRTDATFYLGEVWEEEPARVCAVTGETTVIAQPGDPWPAHCGTSWDYVTPTAPGAVYTLITPPSSTDDRLRVDVVASSSSDRYGIGVRYRQTDAGRWTVWSKGPLDLARLAQGAGTTTALTGGVYTQGTLTLSDAVTVTGAQMVSEADLPGAFSGTRTSATYWYAGAGDDLLPPVLPSRQAVPTVGNTEELANGIAVAHAVACATSQARSAAGTLCLAPGVAVLNVADELVTPPANPSRAAWLLIVGASGTGTVDVWFADKDVDVCPPAQDLAAWSSPLTSADLHPGALEFWEAAGGASPGGYACVSAAGPGGATKLGVFPLPESGLVAVDGDVVIGLCGTGFATAAGTCTTWGTGGVAQAMTVDSSLTVLATGDAYLGGPIRSVGGAHLGVAAQGAVVVPYWARAFGSALDLDVQVVALDDDPAGSLRLSPAVSPTSPQPGDTAPSLTITGRLAVTSLGAGFERAGFASLRLVPSRGAAPWLPSPSPGVERVGAVRLLDPAVDSLLAGLDPTP